MTPDFKRIADLLIEARRASRTVAVPADLDLRSVEEAYRVQDLVFASLWPGERPVAWKAGGPSDQVEPTASPIHVVHGSPAALTTVGMNMIGVEAEIAFRIARDVPARQGPYREEEVAAAVGEALVTIELCDTRLADWKGAPALWKLADFQSNSALVVGSGTRDWRAIDFKVQRVELRIGERTIAATGAHPFGNPFRLMPWIAAHCARRAGGLRAGDVVTTGSWTGLEIVLPGHEVIARFPGVGEAAVRLDR
jgi:2-keto-4-pentenoate hydratase